MGRRQQRRSARGRWAFFRAGGHRAGRVSRASAAVLTTVIVVVALGLLLLRSTHLLLYKCLHASEAPHGQVATCPLAHVHPEKSIKKMFETWGFYGTSRLLSLGNITASRMFSRFSMVITSLDSPRPHPLWEGMPYLKAFR